VDELAVMLFRLAILAAIIALIYSALKYAFDPKRRLEQAQKRKQFYFLDTPDNVRKNFLVTYKGVLFEGEKYLGTTEHAFDVVTISITAKNPERLKGFEKNDFYHIEREILTRYPQASIKWKSPINRLL